MLLSSKTVSEIICKRKARELDTFTPIEVLKLLKYFSNTWDDASCFSFLVSDGLGLLEREEANKILVEIQKENENKKRKIKPFDSSKFNLKIYNLEKEFFKM